MKKVQIVFALIILSGCASFVKHESNVVTGNTGSIWKGTIEENLAIGAKLIVLGYGEEQAGHSENVEAFQNKGFDATYFAPSEYMFSDYPEVYILSRKKTNEITILVVGTDSNGDWIQNMKTKEYHDVCNANTYHIPAGHGGFRNGVMNLIGEKFFTEVITGHIQNNDVRNNKGGMIDVTIIGHSAGAGIAQLVGPAVDGYKYTDCMDTDNPKLVKTDKWPLKVKNVFAYAPPYAVSPSYGSWEYMSKNYGDKTYMIIRDADFVTTVYNAFTHGLKVPFRHYGKYVRITRDKEVSFESTDWGLYVEEGDSPHSSNAYHAALKNHAEKITPVAVTAP